MGFVFPLSSWPLAWIPWDSRLHPINCKLEGAGNVLKSWNTLAAWTVGLILQGCSGGTQGVDGMVTPGQTFSDVSDLDPLS